MSDSDKKKSDSDSDSEKYVVQRKVIRNKAKPKRTIDLSLLDKLVSSTEFDQKYWEGDGDRIYLLIDSELSKADLDLVKIYLENKDNAKENSWILLWKARIAFISNNDRLTANIAKWLEASLNLGNPYAMIEYARTCLSQDQKDEKDQLYLKALEKGYYAGLINHIDHYFNKMADEWEGEDVDKEIEPRVLADLERLAKFRENDLIINAMLYTYSNLDRLFNNYYVDQYVKYIRKQQHGIETLIEEHTEYIEIIIDKYLELKEEHKRLEEAYNELKKVKEMDFNNIVSNQVGGYLN